MKLLVSKNLLILVIFLLLNNILLSQKYKDHKWRKPKPFTEIPDSLKGEDAVMILNDQSIYNDIIDIASGKVSSKKIVMQKVKILTEKGLEDYSKVFVNLYPEETITVLDARTIKPNGKVINLKAQDIKEMEYISPYSKETRYKQLRFFIPGVEIGDEIEIIYKIKRKYLNTGDDLFLHTYLPCLESVLMYRASKPFVQEVKVYNGMPQYTTNNTETATELNWRLTNIPSFENQHNAIYTSQVPYIRFVIRQYKSQYNSIDITTNNWDEVYKQYSKSYNKNETIGASKGRYLNDFVEEFQLKHPDKSKEELFIEINKFIYDSIDVKILDEKESDRALGYYLFNRYINHYHLNLLYKELFKMLDIKFYICFGRNKYDGVLDMGFVAPHIIDYIFYSFYKDDKLNFVYPSYSSSKYLLNELPVSIKGTNIMMLSEGSENSIFCESKAIILPYNSPEVNYKLRNINIQIDNLNDTVYNSNSRSTLSGVYSTFYRESHKEHLNAKEYDFYGEFLIDNDLEVDSIKIVDSNSEFPFNYSIEAQHKLPLTFNKLDENVYNLKISELLNVSNPYSTTEKRYLDYYSRYLFNDQTSIILNFKNKITVENIDNLQDMSLSNEFGSITLNIVQKEENKIILNISYQIHEHKLSAKDYDKLINLNKALDNILSQSITITTS